MRQQQHNVAGGLMGCGCLLVMVGSGMVVGAMLFLMVL